MGFGVEVFVSRACEMTKRSEGTINGKVSRQSEAYPPALLSTA